MPEQREPRKIFGVLETVKTLRLITHELSKDGIGRGIVCEDIG
jgi:hypothetical protein